MDEAASYFVQLFYDFLVCVAFGNHGSPVKEEKNETFNELQRLTTSLTESLTDKDTALKIQRKTNK